MAPWNGPKEEEEENNGRKWTKYISGIGTGTVMSEWRE